jgi:hypothetical protein
MSRSLTGRIGWCIGGTSTAVPRRIRFVTAAIFLILALGSAARVYQVLQKGKVPAIIERHQRAV